MLEAGRPAAALAEVTRMPGRAAGSKWMEQARRYIEARRALDLIETAAILEPRRLRAIDGAAVDEPSPLAPSSQHRRWFAPPPTPTPDHAQPKPPPNGTE